MTMNGLYNCCRGFIASARKFESNLTKELCRGRRQTPDDLNYPTTRTTPLTTMPSIELKQVRNINSTFIHLLLLHKVTEETGIQGKLESEADSLSASIAEKIVIYCIHRTLHGTLIFFKLPPLPADRRNHGNT